MSGYLSGGSMQNGKMAPMAKLNVSPF